MKIEEIIEEIRLELTGYILDMEISDETIAATVKKALRELERYWDETTMITVPFARCIDLSGKEFEEHVSSIVKVYRTVGVGNASDVSAASDPLYLQQ